MSPRRWTRTACLGAQPGELALALRRIVEQGFLHIELAACSGPRPLEELEALADSGLLVSSAALRLRPGFSLADLDVKRRRLALSDLQQQVNDAARLGAVCAVLDGLPPPGPGRACFTEAVAHLAGHAAGRMVRLASVADPADLLDWLAQEALGGLGGGLLVRAGEKLGFLNQRIVHIRVERGADVASLEATLDALGYQGIVALPGPLL